MAILPHEVHLDTRTRMPRGDPRDTPSIWTPRQRFVWEKASFTVPADVTEERVQFVADKYRRKFGKVLEEHGFEVLGMEMPHEGHDVVSVGITEPNRRRYIIWAKVRRRPVEIRVDVPDRQVAAFQRSGFSLVS